MLAGFAVFVVIIALLVVPSFTTPDIRTYTPTPAASWRPATGTRPDTVTIDAGDEKRWRFVDLERGAVLTPPDTSGWDAAIRRFHIVPWREIADAGPVSFDSVTQAPRSGYVISRFGRDTSNDAVDHWYVYSYLSHLLTSKGNVYVVRTRGGRYAKFQVLSYYCPGPTPGCVTIRYAYVPGG